MRMFFFRKIHYIEGNGVDQNAFDVIICFWKGLMEYWNNLNVAWFDYIERVSEWEWEGGGKIA